MEEGFTWPRASEASAYGRLALFLWAWDKAKDDSRLLTSGKLGRTERQEYLAKAHMGELFLHMLLHVIIMPQTMTYQEFKWKTSTHWWVSASLHWLNDLIMPVSSWFNHFPWTLSLNIALVTKFSTCRLLRKPFKHKTFMSPWAKWRLVTLKYYWPYKTNLWGN